MIRSLGDKGEPHHGDDRVLPLSGRKKAGELTQTKEDQC